MFTNESTKWIVTFVLLAGVLLGGTMLTDKIVTADDELIELPISLNADIATEAKPDPNTFTAQLDDLRQQGQQARINAAARQVFDHSSDLDTLREHSAYLARTNATLEFASQLDSLRAAGQLARITAPTNPVSDHTSDLDALRAQAMRGSQPTLDLVINNANDFASHLDQLHQMVEVVGPAHHSEANAFTTALDRLRLQGQAAASIIEP